MPESHDPRTAATYVVGITDDLPYAVRAQVSSKPSDLDDSDLASTSQAYFADVPASSTQPPRPEENGFVALGAKEGHGIGRRGVALPNLPPPPRPPVSGTRRPVVALLDSQVRPHEWFRADGELDPFSRDARDEPEGWRPETGSPAAPIELPVDGDDATATHTGHGTFIAGLVRQLAPAARVVSMPMMNEMGIVDDRLVHLALSWVLDRCRRADTEHRPELFVDVVNMSFGHYLRGDKVVPQVDATLTVLRDLGDIGVRVVASAGNRASVRGVLPAAWSPDGWSPEDPDDGHTGLVGVAALDPDGGLAVYSNHGDWVRLAAPGTALVSTLPAVEPVCPWPPKGRVVPEGAEDPNFQRSGFARWSGTSFASAWVSATLVGHLLDDQMGDLGDVTPGAVRSRAARALAATLDEGDVRLWVEPGATG